MSELHKHKLITHNSIPYDVYTLTFRGYDYLAINVFVQRGLIIAIGRQIGVGKESDVFEAFGPRDPATDIAPKYVLKLHRLGRISFRTVKNKRDYLRHNKYNTASKGSWLYLSRLSALKEYGFMKILASKSFPVPQPIDVCRHGILMSFIGGFPLYHAKRIKKPAILCNKALSLIVEFAKYGLVHCDFNEFNLLVTDSYDLFVIDFPQMVSIHHRQGIQYFNRDVLSIYNYFKNKHGFEIQSKEIPQITETFLKNEIIDHLDQVIEASGYYGKNEQIHTEDFETLHAFFASTLHDDKVKESDEQKEHSEMVIENEELSEKERWRLKKMRKKLEFEKRKCLKKAIAEHKENVLGTMDATQHTQHSHESDKIILSETEIRRRLKKKKKNEVKKHKYKKAKKTNDN
eukprot:35473_1